MTVALNPYINFKNNAREAIEFYHSVFGGELTVSTFADFNAPVEPGEETLVMHAQLTAPELTLMASDTPNHMEHSPTSNISISLSGDDTEKLTGYYTALSDGGTIAQPLTEAPWGDSFGMFADRFGVNWLVNISGAAA